MNIGDDAITGFPTDLIRPGLPRLGAGARRAVKREAEKAAANKAFYAGIGLAHGLESRQAFRARVKPWSKTREEALKVAQEASDKKRRGVGSRLIRLSKAGTRDMNISVDGSRGRRGRF